MPFDRLTPEDARTLVGGRVTEAKANQFAYSPNDFLGRGTYSEVYRAVYRGRDVAVKVFLEPMREPDMQERATPRVH
jgi:hypothetical protein